MTVRWRDREYGVFFFFFGVFFWFFSKNYSLAQLSFFLLFSFSFLKKTRILPVIAVRDVDDAISEMSCRPEPLAMYIFGRSSRMKRTVVARTRAGGVTINSCLWHGMHSSLPSGGIGASSGGIKQEWRGRAAFETFSNQKGILEKTEIRCCGPCSEAWWVYPPFTRWKEMWLRVLMRFAHW